MTTATSAQDQKNQAEHEELLAWLDTVQNVAGVGGALAKLFYAELRLALSSAKGLLVLGLVVLPVTIFAWLGLSTLLSWLVYWACIQYITPDAAVAAALFAFLSLQIGALLLIKKIATALRQNMSFSATKRHLKQFGEEFGDALPRTQG